MSHQMLLNVLRIPLESALNNELSGHQLWVAANRAASTIDAMQSDLNDAATKLAARDSEIERLKCAAANLMADAIEREAEMDRLRKNAERYEWFRARVSGRRIPGSLAAFVFPGWMDLPPIADIMTGSVAQHLDAAIDAALSEETKGR